MELDLVIAEVDESVGVAVFVSIVGSTGIIEIKSGTGDELEACVVFKNGTVLAKLRSSADIRNMA